MTTGLVDFCDSLLQRRVVANGFEEAWAPGWGRPGVRCRLLLLVRLSALVGLLGSGPAVIRGIHALTECCAKVMHTGSGAALPEGGRSMPVVCGAVSGIIRDRRMVFQHELTCRELHRGEWPFTRDAVWVLRGQVQAVRIPPGACEWILHSGQDT